MTDKEFETRWNSYLTWKSKKLKPFLKKREQALKDFNDARERYFDGAKAFNLAKITSDEVDARERDYDGAAANYNRIHEEFWDAVDKFNFQLFLAETGAEE